MKRVKLDFMICPDELIKKCYVSAPVRIRILNQRPEFLRMIGLGASGKKMVAAKLEFYYSKHIAEALIKMGWAVMMD